MEGLIRWTKWKRNMNCEGRYEREGLYCIMWLKALYLIFLFINNEREPRVCLNLCSRDSYFVTWIDLIPQPILSYRVAPVKRSENIAQSKSFILGRISAWIIGHFCQTSIIMSHSCNIPVLMYDSSKPLFPPHLVPQDVPVSCELFFLSQEVSHECP